MWPAVTGSLTTPPTMGATIGSARSTQTSRSLVDGDGDAREHLERQRRLLVDRASSRISFVASTEGGMDIEEVAHATPEKIVDFSVDPASGLSDFHGRRVAFALGLEGDLVKQCVALVKMLFKAFVEKDMEMLEINPLIVTEQGQIKVLDAKVSFDNNALYRQKDVMALRDETEEDPKELEASKYDLNYIALDGEIGKAVSCSIYLNRPSPCREFDQSGENGLRNEACDRARERYGLPPLPVPLPLSLPETTIVEEIGVVQFAGCHSGVEQGTITH